VPTPYPRSGPGRPRRRAHESWLPGARISPISSITRWDFRVFSVARWTCGLAARVVATGRSDFPNQLNNSLGFPGIFRGALDVRARTISDEMCLAAAAELAAYAEAKAPVMADWEVFPREAVAVGMKAQEQGLARVSLTRDELHAMASRKISEAREMIEMLMREGAIAPVPNIE